MVRACTPEAADDEDADAEPADEGAMQRRGHPGAVPVAEGHVPIPSASTGPAGPTPAAAAQAAAGVAAAGPA
eukprot:6143296-Lingulodinium_polyedra.AAC.1